MRELRVAVIGAGRIADEHLRSVLRQPAARLVAVCDRSPALADFAARKFGADSAYTDHAALLAAAHADVVHVLTPAGTHQVLAEAALDAGANVIVEKPAALHSRGVASLLECASRADRVVVEDQNYRFNRSLQRLCSLVRDGELGELVDVEVRVMAPQEPGDSRYADANLLSPSHGLPGGFAHEFLTHVAYLTLLFVPGVSDLRVSRRRRREDLPSPFDELVGHGRFPGGTVTMVFSAAMAPARISVSLRGTGGWAEVDVANSGVRHYPALPAGGQFGPFLSQLKDGARLASGALEAVKDRVVGRSGYEGIATFLDRTYEALRNGTEPPVSAQDMRRSTALVDELIGGGGSP